MYLFPSDDSIVEAMFFRVENFIIVVTFVLNTKEIAIDLKSYIKTVYHQKLKYMFTGVIRIN